MTDCYRESDYGEPIVALKSYILSPFSEDAHVAAVLDVDLAGAARRRGRAAPRLTDARALHAGARAGAARAGLGEARRSCEAGPAD